MIGRSTSHVLTWLLPLSWFAYLLLTFSRWNEQHGASTSDASRQQCSESRLKGQTVLGVELTEKERLAAANSVMDKLLRVPAEDVGKIAICASIRNEGRFITEWLLYNRALGVDRFYLYDTGSNDNTIEKLNPWVAAGTVKLHKWNKDQGGGFQRNSLEHCSRTYANATEWILDCDVDEYYVVTSDLTGTRTDRPPRIDEMPDAPLRKLLFDNFLYMSTDAIVVSRSTWKNNGIQRLPDEGSVLSHQNLREVHHSIPYDKNEFTKSLLHTRNKFGWILPGAHLIKHETLPKEKAKVITVNGQSARVVDNDEGPVRSGTLFTGLHPTRAYEPLIMYHYIERDLDNCLEKYYNAVKVRKGGWRDQLGAMGCTSDNLYQQTPDWKPIHASDGFYAAGIIDNSMSRSWYGLHLPDLIHITIQQGSFHQDVAPPLGVDPDPEMTARWIREGLNPDNGMPIEGVETAVTQMKTEVKKETG